MEEIKKMWRTSLFWAIVFIILGLFLLFYPETTISMISYIIGTIIIVIGCSAFYRYYKAKGTGFGFEIVYGIVCIIGGLVLVLNPKALASLIPLVLGIFIIVNSAMKVQYAFDMKKRQNDKWVATLVLSFLTLVCGVVLIFNPFEGALVLTQVIGIFIILYAVFDLAECLLIKRNLTPKETIVEAQIEEVVVETPAPKKKRSSKKKETKDQEPKDE